MIFCYAMERKWLKYEREIRLAGFLLVMTLILSNLAAILLFNGAVRHYRRQMESGLAATARMAERMYDHNRLSPANDLEAEWNGLAENSGLSAIGMADSNGKWLAATNRFLLEGYLFDIDDQERVLGWSKLRPGRMARGEGGDNYGYVNYSLRAGSSGNLLVLLAPAGALPTLEAAARLQNMWTVIVFLAALAALIFYLRMIFGPFRQMARLARDGSPRPLVSDVELVMEGFREMISQLRREGRELSDRFDRERERADDLEQFSRQILESVDKGIVCLNNQGVVLASNPAAREIMGREVRTWSDLMGQDEYKAIQGGGRQVIREIGGSTIIRIESSRLKNSAGREIGHNLVISDITDQKRMEELEGLTEKSALLQNAYQGLLAKIAPLLQEIGQARRDGDGLERAASELERLISEQGRLFSYQEGAERTEDSGMVCASADMRQAMELARRVAPADSTVLITGASGTGKELVARAVHELSPRADNRFMAVNCGAFSPDLIANELFGHEREAFTGAGREKKGLLEAAAGGSVFFDEIGDLPLPMQVNLLRVLQERSFLRVGGTREIAVDIRVLAATNRDLKKEVERGAFRQDLYYRLNVIALHLPNLAERREDIPLLVRHFIAKHTPAGATVKSVAPEVMARLQRYDYPGNVRELENIVARGLALCDGPQIEPRHLLGEVDGGALRIARREPRQWPTLEENERQYILSVMEEVGGNKTRAARILDIDRVSLWRKLKRYRIDSD